MNTKKTAMTLVAAMMVVAVLAIAVSAICTPLVCEKNCSTKVEQCDIETVMQLTPIVQLAPNVNIVRVGGAVYIDMHGDGDGEIDAGDIRLTYTCPLVTDCYNPNTKVYPHDKDIDSTFADLPDPIFSYMDSNLNGGFDLGDAIYLDCVGNNNNQIDVNDIRLTASPPYNVLNPNGSVAIYAGTYGPAWSRVLQNDGDHGAPLVDIGAGTIQALGGIIDGDCSGTWTCPDKIYLNQPTGLVQFDNFVTIGDLRLYMPPDEDVMPEGMGECMPVCGTKVEQCSKDAVYALRVATGAQWGYVEETVDGIFKPGPHGEAAYIDMDPGTAGFGVVSIGDVRLTYAASELYPPNSKVVACDIDLDDPLVLVPAAFADGVNTDNPQAVFRFADVDGVPGYSLGDPVYMDTDDSLDVSEYDVRITEAPVCDILNPDGSVRYHAGEWGANWSIVGPYDHEEAFDIVLAMMPNRAGALAATVNDLLGYIDSDCSLTWTCVDKLYLQQLVSVQGVGQNNYNNFVTIGDIRLYVPPAAMGPGPGEPCWEPCATKVWQCDVDLVYAVGTIADYAAGAQVRYFDEDGDGVYSWNDAIDGDGVYFDMDNSGDVSEGDIRLSNVSTQYPPNTKVGGDKQYNDDLQDAFDPATNDKVIYADIDGIAGFSLGDPLYLKMNVPVPPPAPNIGITVGDIRLTACPVYDGFSYGGTIYAKGEIGEAWTRVVPGDIDVGFGWPSTGIPVALVPGQDHTLATGPEDITRIFDSDCSGTWTCPDKLYLQQLANRRFAPQRPAADNVGDFVTIGDERLYIPPSNETSGPVTPDCPWDLNDDTNVDINDVLLMIPHWGTNWSPGDFSPDGNIDINDVIAMIPHWGPCP